MEIWPPASGEHDKSFNLAITSNTLPVGILSLQDDVMKRYRELMAGVPRSAVPMLIIFSLFQRAFTCGVTVGALKG